MSQHTYTQDRAKLRSGGWLRGACLAAACFLAASCAVAPQQFTEKQALDTNQEVGRSENDLMLLNIVRAELREPLVYTNYEKFTEALPTTSLSLSLTSPSITQTAGSSQFDAESMDRDQQYLAEVTTPVTPMTFKYYYDQGWPASLLLHLFVGEIRVMHDAQTERYSNYPFDLQSYQAFDLLANELGGCRFTLKKPAQTAANGTASLPVFELTVRAVSGAAGSDVASKACDEALKTELQGLNLCDPNTSEDKLTDCVEFVYRSPSLLVTYLGDLLREQWFGDINKPTLTDGSPKILGVITYSDACFFIQRQEGKETPETCNRYCNAIFVMRDESPAAADPKGMAPQCEWPADLAEVGKPTAPPATGTQTAGENGGTLSVNYEDGHYDLPLNYLGHAETMHTLEIADLLMGYQIGVKADTDAAKKAAKQ